MHLQGGVADVAGQLVRFLVANERLLVVAASTMIMSLSHTALRPVLPVFAKAGALGFPASSADNSSFQYHSSMGLSHLSAYPSYLQLSQRVPVVN